jgi:DNA replication ATP-dependent helicase Dna2
MRDGSSLFSKRTFDYCIVDEASQITLPAALGPLRFADTFILVGDHHQLPPLVRNPVARQQGYETSLFKLLSDSPHAEAATAELKLQYRMTQAIMSISSALYYEQKLAAGSEEVANQRLQLPQLDRTLARLRATGESGAGWLAQVLDPSFAFTSLRNDADVPTVAPLSLRTWTLSMRRRTSWVG